MEYLHKKRRFLGGKLWCSFSTLRLLLVVKVVVVGVSVVEGLDATRAAGVVLQTP